MGRGDESLIAKSRLHALLDVTRLCDTLQRANMFQKTPKTSGYMKIKVCKISPGGGGGRKRNYIWPVAYYLLTL